MAMQYSRRQMLGNLKVAGAAGGLMALGVVGGSRAADNSSQLRKQDVRYQDQPKGNQRCEGCKNFVGPSACRVVQGSVNPNGWCLLFQGKTA
ncbi:MAG TPA: hypothetical protein VGF62_03495 [Rhizomicrobium sp.]|jgi:hypothetical protein